MTLTIDTVDFSRHYTSRVWGRRCLIPVNSPETLSIYGIVRKIVNVLELSGYSSMHCATVVETYCRIEADKTGPIEQAAP